MLFVQGKFDEDFVGIHYEDSKATTTNEDSEAATTNEDSKAATPSLEFPPVESQDSGFVPDLAFPPVEVSDSGINIVDLEFPSTDSGAVVQSLVDENGSVGVLSRIRGWLGKE